ncbi:hypothetical protein [Cohaesibacter gelatinilyticus]|uniref:hypothetical protein n=1 Tax=Cohaesibacter gelatinilyticus TaxID=372072 RepID=UPI001143DFDF|nr:hypothetical protein [Cohaesibacter gelatinilyticus]
MEEFFESKEAERLVKQNVARREKVHLRSKKRLRRKGLDHPLDLTRLNKELEAADLPLKRAMEKHRELLQQRPEIPVTISHEPLSPASNGPEFYLAMQATADGNHISVDHFRLGIGFFSDLSDFLSDQEAWLQGLQSSVSVERLSYNSLPAKLVLEEYETEDTYIRYGSGNNGFRAELFLQPSIYDALLGVLPQHEETEQFRGVLGLALRPFVVARIKCAPFSAPEKKKFEPGTPIADAISKTIEIEQITFTHLELLDDAEDVRDADFVSKDQKKYRTTDQWHVVQTKAPASENATSKQEVHPATKFIIKAGFWSVALYLLYIKIF